jgi:hypothetical protein
MVESNKDMNTYNNPAKSNNIEQEFDYFNPAKLEAKKMGLEISSEKQLQRYILSGFLGGDCIPPLVTYLASKGIYLTKMDGVWEYPPKLQQAMEYNRLVDVCMYGLLSRHGRENRKEQKNIENLLNEK